MAINNTTGTSAYSWSPDLVTFNANDVIPEALVLQTSTVSGSVEGDAPSVRVPFVKDAAAEFAAEGDEIPEADPELAETVVYTGKVSQLVRLSREQWTQYGTESLMSTSVARAVTNRANQAYVAQADPSGGNTPPAGLANITGVIDGGAIDADLDALADAFAAIETNGGMPTHIIASPQAWGALRKLKTGTDRNISLLGAGTSDAEKRLLGIPVLTTPALTGTDLMVIDQSAVVSAVGAVNVMTSEHAYFSSDSIALRCTFRFGANTVYPDRIAKLTVETTP